MDVLERFLRYAAVETTSDESAAGQPSSAGELVLARMLEEEMRSIGIADAHCDRYGYVYGHIEANAAGEPIGLIAHLDTSPDAPGTGVKPIVSGGIVRTDGTTLLGADDKAGIAEILTAAEYVVSHPEIKHPRICIAFTPDEETGRGTEHFDLERFGAATACTVDGGALGELEWECFNAARADIYFTGKSVHPGTARGIMVNAMMLAHEFAAAIPQRQRPEFTQGYEGFFHLTQMKGCVGSAFLSYIIRDHSRELFEDRKKLILSIAQEINSRYPDAVLVKMRDQYYNMREVLERCPEVLDRVRAAYLKAGVTPVEQPIRGGTDGARLSFRGLPCPNIFTGGMNFHSRDEYIPIASMEKAVEVIINLVQI